MKLIIIIAILYSSSALALSNFNCFTKSKKIHISGAIVQGDIIGGKVTIKHVDLKAPLTMELSMKWYDKKNGELKILHFDKNDKINRLLLVSSKGKGKLDINLADMKGGDDIFFKKLSVKCKMH